MQEPAVPHRTSPSRLAAPVAVLALALTACGAGGGEDVDARSPGAPAAPERAASGGDVAVGEAVTGKVAEGPGAVTYEVVARKVDVGTEAEAAEAVADAADAEGRVPAVAHLEYTHRGGPALTGGSEVHDAAAVFADGQRGGILVGAPDDAPGCEDPYGVESWKQGESHVFCETYLVPADATSVEVHWSEEDGEPWVWKFPRE
ncbi:hypothetical protein ACFQ9U_20160 [Streptomyces sp. NPDC056568]|uniref:hypothetical protein n=1 Tax=Streptomyces sp. NPDC056568 TaxID=3345866 RepID=UPI0036B8067B